MVKVKLYHAENLRFNDNNFTGDFVKGGQRIDFYSVGVHHQSAVVELKIKEVWYGGRTILLHTNRKCSTVIVTVICWYAMHAIIE